MLIVFDPAKDREKQMRIEPDMLNFRPGSGEHASSPHGIDGIDRASFLGIR